MSELLFRKIGIAVFSSLSIFIVGFAVGRYYNRGELYE